MITYSTNWMGPISLKWYQDRNLTVTKTVELFGDLVEVSDVIQYWSGGRIDINGTNSVYGYEISLPIMRDDCYKRFSTWLRGIKTESVWTLYQLVEEYEKTNPKIIWASDVFGDK